MKFFTIVLLALAFLFMVTPVQAADIQLTFQWDKNPEPDIANYRLYQAEASGDYTKGTFVAEFEHLPAFNPQESAYTFDAVTGVTYFWVLTAVDGDGFESDWSNEVSLLVEFPSAPTNLIINAIVVNP